MSKLVCIGVDQSLSSAGIVVFVGDKLELAIAYGGKSVKKGRAKTGRFKYTVTRDVVGPLFKAASWRMWEREVDGSEDGTARMYQLDSFIRYLIEWIQANVHDAKLVFCIEIPMGGYAGGGAKSDWAYATVVHAVRDFFKRCIKPSVLKQFVTGKGNAKKEQVMLDVYIKWKFRASVNDISDAYGLARYCQTIAKEVVAECQKNKS